MNYAIKELFGRRMTPIIASAVSGVAVGGVFGYILGKRSGDTFEEDVHEEVEGSFDASALSDSDPQESFSEKEKGASELFESAPSFSSFLDLNRADLSLDLPMNEVDEDYYSFEELDEDAELSIEDEENFHGEPQKYNVFEEAAKNKESEWNLEAELSTRDPREPYVIHYDEWEEDSDVQSGAYLQQTFSYYEGDDIMCDEHDTPIYEYYKSTGPLKFGHGSKDPHVVYIRNEIMEREFEILYHPGRFEVEVLGLDDGESFKEGQLRHAREQRRFREEEE
jgi:hypothetical protein